ncbi:MAG: hypothetical protein ACRD4O_11305 [Bryobacteraceae bacterium]
MRQPAADHLPTFLFETSDIRYRNSRPQFYRRYFEKLRMLPGVESAAGPMFLPMTGNNDVKLSFENPEHPVAAGQRPNAFIDIAAHRGSPPRRSVSQYMLKNGKPLRHRHRSGWRYSAPL